MYCNAVTIICISKVTFVLSQNVTLLKYSISMFFIKNQQMSSFLQKEQGSKNIFQLFSLVCKVY